MNELAHPDDGAFLSNKRSEQLTHPAPANHEGTPERRRPVSEVAAAGSCVHDLLEKAKQREWRRDQQCPGPAPGVGARVQRGTRGACGVALGMMVSQIHAGSLGDATGLVPDRPLQ